MLSFYPGPSKVHPEVLGFIQEAFSNGVVSINHRSERFEVLLKDTLQILHEKWNIPQDYTLYFIYTTALQDKLADPEIDRLKDKIKEQERHIASYMLQKTEHDSIVATMKHELQIGREVEFCIFCISHFREGLKK
jgi:hypothetical protein